MSGPLRRLTLALLACAAGLGLAAERATPQFTLGEVGPWGQLEIASIVISPPFEYIPEYRDPPQPTRWAFPGMSAAQVEATLEGAGIPRQQRARFMASARAEGGGISLWPAPDTVATLSPQVRADLYARLAANRQNPVLRHAFRYFDDSLDAWIGRSRLAPRTLELVRPFCYARDGFVYFADLDAVRPALTDPAELRRLTKALMRETTLLARLRLPPGVDVDAIAEYWGRGGRRTDVRPLLESVADLGPGSAIDIAHLLPPFARLHLYRYPKVSLADVDKPMLPNCFWTALNFFSDDADDRYLEFPNVLAALKRDYYLVHDGFQLGDLVLFQDADGTFYHAAVYVADGLVFGKNGESSLAPWTLLPLKRLRGYYPEHEGLLSYYRRKDF